jgi:hypothetical protein
MVTFREQGFGPMQAQEFLFFGPGLQTTKTHKSATHLSLPIWLQPSYFWIRFPMKKILRLCIDVYSIQWFLKLRLPLSAPVQNKQTNKPLSFYVNTTDSWPSTLPGCEWPMATLYKVRLYVSYEVFLSLGHLASSKNTRRTIGKKNII